jgi:hypothetical protein
LKPLLAWGEENITPGLGEENIAPGLGEENICVRVKLVDGTLTIPY